MSTTDTDIDGELTDDRAELGPPRRSRRPAIGGASGTGAPTHRVGRRRVLRAIGATSVVALAGCLGDGSGAGGAGGDPTDSGEGNGGTGGAETSALFGQSARFADSYAFEMRSLETGETLGWSGRVDGEDSYMRMEEDGGAMEFYSVGGETYIVQDGGCFLMRPEEFEAAEGEDVDEPDMGAHEGEAAAHPELEAVGRDTIDGEEVYVFELSASEASEHDGAVTYYVSVETGYLRRVESEDTAMDFHSWGDVDPIEPPEMECMEMGGWDEPGEMPAVGFPDEG
ncbi:hypothetical protein [Halalkalicoccus sp. NIPERK01]|uniref:hypothetical protein n=1 Tax=Halalkalicoccus sp. NIPERK01 TaxID=3053469 RepID=UPI00256EEFED|nr:hypothetical protein [Halalkalicoccus sp. NIPERK01]MDL5362429.1 hypothetical protein [Halalkalicoccus sp. NIPERK01]